MTLLKHSSRAFETVENKENDSPCLPSANPTCLSFRLRLHPGVAKQDKTKRRVYQLHASNNITCTEESWLRIRKVLR